MYDSAAGVEAAVMQHCHPVASVTGHEAAHTEGTKPKQRRTQEDPTDTSPQVRPLHSEEHPSVFTTV